KALEEIRAARSKNPALEPKLTALAGTTQGGRGGGGGRGAFAAGPDTISSVSATLNTLLRLIQGADTAPTTQAVAAIADRRAALAKLMQSWNTMKSTDVK